MRRVSLALVSGVLLSLVFPSSAHAWWGWFDELSGAGRFTGLEVEARLYCFGATDGDPAARFVQSAADQISSAFEQMMTVGALKPKEAKNRDEFSAALLKRFGSLRSQSLAATATRISHSTAAILRATTSALGGEIEKLCGDFACAPEQQVALTYVATRLRVAESDYAKAHTLAEQRSRLTASAGVSFSACPTQRDLTRRGAIGLTFRKMDTYGDRKEEFAGGNKISLSTLTPMVSWRPLFDVVGGKYDYVDLATGAGVYWLASDGDRPGGFDAFSGIILEPIRFDFHAPALSPRTGPGWAAIASASFRFGYAIFPAGFEPNAFGTTRFPEQSQRIRGEWVPYWAIYFDVGRFIFYSFQGNQ